MDDATRILRAFFLPDEECAAGSSWAPAADVYRTPDGWLVKLELAGVSPEDLEVRVERRRVTISGIRRDRHSCASVQQYHMEIAYSRFAREIVLPDELDAVEVSIDQDGGMLLVRLQAGR